MICSFTLFCCNISAVMWCFFGLLELLFLTQWLGKWQDLNHVASPCDTVPRGREHRCTSSGLIPSSPTRVHLQTLTLAWRTNPTWCHCAVYCKISPIQLIYFGFTSVVCKREIFSDHRTCLSRRHYVPSEGCSCLFLPGGGDRSQPCSGRCFHLSSSPPPPQVVIHF